MIKLHAIAFLVTTSCIQSAYAQEISWMNRTVRLSAPDAVARNVDHVSWSPEETDIAYTTKTKTGYDLGVYDLRHKEAKTVAVLGAGEKLGQLVWMNVGQTALIEIRKSLGQGAKANELVTLYSLTCGDMTLHKLWSQTAAKDKNLNLDISASPTRCHAIVEASLGDERAGYVVTDGATTYLYSADLSKAMTDGYGQVGWSIDGTMLYDQGISIKFRAETALNNAVVELDDGAVEDAGNSNGALNVITSDATGNKLELETVLYRKLGRLRFIHTPDPNSTVLECMSSNGAIRQIKFPGMHQEPAKAAIPFVPHTQSLSAKLGQSTATVQSLWLVPEKDADRPQVGLLVSAEADRFWQSPSGNAIAFVCQGALIVRTLESSR